MEKLESLAKQGTIARGKYGVPYSVRSTALMPLWLVDHAGTKAVLPLLGNMAYMGLASGFLMTDMLVLRSLLLHSHSLLCHTCAC